MTNTSNTRKRGRPPGRHVAKPKPAGFSAAPAPKAVRDIPRLDDLPAWTIADFCLAYSMSRSFYYVLRHEGRGPKETRLGSKILITREAAAQWLHKQEKASAPA